jgi:Flp pilus assembly protein TadB
MHPPRPRKVFQGPAFVDGLAEWLLTHCPCTAMALLLVLILGPRITIANPYPLVAAIVAVDLTVNVVRERRQQRRPRRTSGAIRPNVTA